MHSTVGQKLGREDLGVSSFNNRMRVHDVYSLPFSITSSQAATRGLKWLLRLAEQAGCGSIRPAKVRSGQSRHLGGFRSPASDQNIHLSSCHPPVNESLSHSDCVAGLRGETMGDISPACVRPAGASSSH